MADTYCVKCGEPWDRAELGGEGAMSDDEAKLFYAGEGCPSCRWGQGRKRACAACGGWGKKAKDGKAVTCEYCEGTGVDNPEAPAWKELRERTRRELNLQPGSVGW